MTLTKGDRLKVIAEANASADLAQAEEVIETIRKIRQSGFHMREGEVRNPFSPMRGVPSTPRSRATLSIKNL